MKRITLLLATAALVAPLNFANAADPYVDTGYDWSGMYIGLFGGFGFGSSESQDRGSDFFDDSPPTGLTLKLDPSGALVGLDAGYNWQSSALVLGVGADVGYNFADDSSSVFIADGSNGLLDDDFGAVEYGLQGSITGKVGYAMDRSLLYVKGGLAAARVKQEAGDLDAGIVDPTDIASSSKTLLGFTIGAGAEFAFSDNWSAFIEYNYVNLENVSTTNIDGDSIRFKNEMNLVKAGINYNF